MNDNNSMQASDMNIAEHLLFSRSDDTALVFWGEDKLIRRMGRGDLYRRVARLAAALQADAIRPGEVIAAVMPNMPETVISFLAASALGARFAALPVAAEAHWLTPRLLALAPKILCTVDGYYQAGRSLPALETCAALSQALPELRRTVVARYIRGEGHILEGIRAGLMLRAYVDEQRIITEIDFAQTATDTPVFAPFSEKAAITPAWVSQLHYLAALARTPLVAHTPADSLLALVPVGSTAWYAFVGAMAAGVKLVQYEGSPWLNRGAIVFDYTVAEGVSHIAAPLAYFEALAASGLTPAQTHDLKRLHTLVLCDTPVWPEALMDKLRRAVKMDVAFAVALQ